MRAGSNPGVDSERDTAAAGCDSVCCRTTVREVPLPSQPARLPIPSAAAAPASEHASASVGILRERTFPTVTTFSPTERSAAFSRENGSAREGVRPRGRGLRLLRRQAEGEDGAPGPGIELELPTHQLRELPRDREPEAAAGGLMAVVCAVEPVEDVLRMLRRDSRAFVLDDEPRDAVLRLRADSDRRARRRVQDRVLDEDAPDLHHALLVRDGEDVAVEHLEWMVRRPRHRREVAGDDAGDLADRERLALDAQLARVEPGQVEQLRGELREARHLVAHAREELESRLLVHLLVGEQLDEAAQREERGTQLVRRV